MKNVLVKNYEDHKLDHSKYLLFSSLLLTTKILNFGGGLLLEVQITLGNLST